MALNLNEDTEFRDALRSQGIIPPRQVEKSPSPPVIPIHDHKQRDEDDDDDDDRLLADLDESLPQSVMESYRQARLDYFKNAHQRRQRFGTVLPIAKADYQREVTDASREPPQDDNADDAGQQDEKDKGTAVIVYLWEDAVTESRILGQHLKTLATKHPETKFVSIRGQMCIPNYPDQNIPTMIIYKNGNVIKQTIGLASSQAQGFNGVKTPLRAVERLLVDCGAVEGADCDGSDPDGSDSDDNDPDDSS